MRRVDQDPFGFAGSASQFSEDAVKDPEPAPTHEPVVDCLVRAVSVLSIAPHQAVLDDIDDARDDPAVVHPWNAMRQRKKWRDPAHLRLNRQERNILDQFLHDADLESTNHRLRKQFNRSGPRPPVYQRCRPRAARHVSSLAVRAVASIAGSKTARDGIMPLAASRSG